MSKRKKELAFVNIFGSVIAMPDRIVDALMRAPAVLKRYEQLQSEAEQYVGGQCPPQFAKKIRSFSSWLEQQFGQKVSGRQLALARLRSAAASHLAESGQETGSDQLSPKVSL